MLQYVSYILTYLCYDLFFMNAVASQSERIHDNGSYRLLPFSGNIKIRSKLICVDLS
jgi:hypothetical protein